MFKIVNYVDLSRFRHSSIRRYSGRYMSQVGRLHLPRQQWMKPLFLFEKNKVNIILFGGTRFRMNVIIINHLHLIALLLMYDEAK